MGHTILSIQGITKRFPGVVALDNVDFDCRPAEVHALVGENGAGKSTLVKILAGAHEPDSGTVILRGQHTVFGSPRNAQQAGIAVIYQEFNLLPQLSVADNIMLGREPRVAGFIQHKQMRAAAAEVLRRLNINFELDERVSELSVAEQQLVEIAKALALDADLIVMDEPSATLAQHELDNLFHVIRTLREQGVAVIYISHRLEEVFAIADRVTVLKDGKLVGTYLSEELTRADLIRLMVGRSLDETFPPRKGASGEIVLSVRNVSHPSLSGQVTFDLHEGEILGIAGLIGAGRTELARALIGADAGTSGEVELKGETVRIQSPRDAIRRGMIMVPEDRKTQGLVLGLSVAKNITLSILRQLRRSLLLDTRREQSIVEEFMQGLSIRAGDTSQEVRFLSGGNQQKVVLAKFLATRPAVVILDEPTRGIDVGSKLEVYQLISDLAGQGAGVIVISSELIELLGLADRILVMSRGRIAGELAHDEATEEAVMALATA